MTRAEQDFDIFGPDAFLPFGEAWRWRMAGYGVMALSCAFSTTLYWNIGVMIARSI